MIENFILKGVLHPKDTFNETIGGAALCIDRLRQHYI